MKSIMLSIQPKYCELIASGKKTVEVRKTAPKLETPLKCYIYETQNTKGIHGFTILGRYRLGKVIGEFVCDKVKEFTPCAVRLCGLDYNICVSDFFATCLTEQELNEYGKDKPLYGWHIDNLKVYDDPKELGEFYHNAKYYCGDYVNSGYCRICSDNCKYHKGEFFRALDRPPQSWCYCEELRG